MRSVSVRCLTLATILSVYLFITPVQCDGWVSGLMRNAFGSLKSYVKRHTNRRFASETVPSAAAEEAVVDHLLEQIAILQEEIRFLKNAMRVNKFTISSLRKEKVVQRVAASKELEQLRRELDTTQRNSAAAVKRAVESETKAQLEQFKQQLESEKQILKLSLSAAHVKEMQKLNTELAASKKETNKGKDEIQQMQERLKAELSKAQKLLKEKDNEIGQLEKRLKDAVATQGESLKAATAATAATNKLEAAVRTRTNTQSTSLDSEPTASGHDRGSSASSSSGAPTRRPQRHRLSSSNIARSSSSNSGGGKGGGGAGGAGGSSPRKSGSTVSRSGRGGAGR